MLIATTSEVLEIVTVAGGAITSIVGVITAVVSLMEKRRDRETEQRANVAEARLERVDKEEEVQVARATSEPEIEAVHQGAERLRADARREYEAAVAERTARPPKRSYKAIVSMLLGLYALVGGSLAVSVATSEGELTDTAVGITFLALLALGLGLWARRDIKADPDRSGAAMAWTGIVSGALGAIISIGALAEAGTGGPDLTVELSCTAVTVTNEGGTGADPTTGLLQDQAGFSVPVVIPALSPGQSYSQAVPPLAPGIFLRATVDNNTASVQC